MQQRTSEIVWHWIADEGPPAPCQPGFPVLMAFDSDGGLRVREGFWVMDMWCTAARMFEPVAVTVVAWSEMPVVAL